MARGGGGNEDGGFGVGDGEVGGFERDHGGLAPFAAAIEHAAADGGVEDGLLDGVEGESEPVDPGTQRVTGGVA